MEYILISLCVTIILGVSLLWFYSRSSSKLKDQMLLIQSQLDVFQKSLTNQQAASSQIEESRASALQTRISHELSSSRQEFTQGFSQLYQNLEMKVQNLDRRLDGKLGELTQKVETQLKANIKEGFLHFEKVTEHLKNAENRMKELADLGQSVQDLNSLMRMPHLRGSFGEAALEKILNDTLPQQAYQLQYRISPEGTERVDAIVHYQQKILPIDSKFPREQVLALFETGNNEQLESARKTLSEIIRTQAKQIRDKYIKPEHGTTEMALMFLPSETLYFEVLKNPKLAEELRKMQVFVVSPNTLSIALQSLGTAMSYYAMAKGVEKTLLDLRKTQTHLDNFEKRFLDIGTALSKAQDVYQVASTHLGRVNSSITRLVGKEGENPAEILESKPKELVPIEN